MDTSNAVEAYLEYRVTSDLVEAYSECRRKAFLILKGESSCEGHPYVTAVSERAAKNRLNSLGSREGGDVANRDGQAGEITPVKGPTLSVGDLLVTSDIGLSSDQPGSQPRHEPHLVVGTTAVTAGQKLQLAFAGYVIGELNGERPKHGIIVKFDRQPKRVSLHSQYQYIGSIVEVLREWIKRLPTDPPPLMLNHHCPTCPFRQACLKEAEQTDSLSLLDRMTPKVMQQYQRRGVFTVNQLSYTYRPRRRRKRHAKAASVFKCQRALKTSQSGALQNQPL